MDSIYTRSDYAELAKIVHSVSASVTTVFLSTRLWARKTKHKGLWWDDYILIAAWAFQLVGNGLTAASPVYGFNMLNGTKHGVLIQFSGACFLYVAICLGKIAFATTLLRLSTGWIHATLCSVILLCVVSTLAVVVVSWVPACGLPFQVIAIPHCLAPSTVMWVQTGYALCMLASDIVLTSMPWCIIQGVQYIPTAEKWSVACTMSLVGVASFVEVARIAYSMSMPYHRLGEVDFTYGVVASYCLIQAEAAVFIIAQTLPVIRVMLQSGGSSSNSRLVTSVAEPTHSPSDKGKTTATEPPTLGAHEGIELVQLPTGRIVAASSEEAKAFRASSAESRQGEAVEAREPRRAQDDAIGAGFRFGNSFEDEVHKVWADMGLSVRAWSKSPSPGPEQPHN